MATVANWDGSAYTDYNDLCNFASPDSEHNVCNLTGYEGTGYSRALPDIGARYEETETASSPQLSWPIYNETADTYSVWVRGMAPDAGGDSLHAALDRRSRGR